MSHLGQVETWITSALESNDAIADGANGVHNTLAIEGEPHPFVILTLRGEPAVERSLCGSISSIRAVYEVVVSSVDTGFENIEGIEDAINETLAPQYAPPDGDRARFYVSVVSLARRIQQGEKGQYFRAGGTFEFLILP